MKIGNIETKHNVFLGPMAGVTDLSYRILCRELGCDLTYTEMVSAKALLYKNKNTEVLLKTVPQDHPCAMQIFGSDPDIMADMGEYAVNKWGYEIVDVNMGCPVPKVVNNHEGSALMKNPQLVEKILSTMVKRISKPVTVKIRRGFDENNINAVEIAKIAENCGVAAIAVHGRTREQYYSGNADWNIIKEVKEAVNIPVIGNGDIVDGESAKKMMDETGCDGVMVARAARGNPWIFNEINTFLETGQKIEKPSLQEVVDMIIRHGEMLVDLKGEYTGIREMRKHVAWYTQGMPHSSQIRRRVNELTNIDELRSMVRTLLV